MLINSLNPYIEVLHIGTKTVGKYQASITLYDSPDFRRLNANPLHLYAMQPLVAATANKNDVQVPNDGLTPTQDLFLEEEVNNFGILGYETEPLLAKDLSHIETNNRIGNAPKSKTAKTVFDNNDLLPHSKEMYID